MAASAATMPRDTSVQRRAWKGSANKASAKCPRVWEEATTGGASSSATPQEPFLKPWRPERLPLTRTLERPSTPRLEEKSERRVNFDPRGPCPPSAGATDRSQSKERRLAKKLPAGVPLSAIYIDEEGRADMSWRNGPTPRSPQGR